MEFSISIDETHDNLISFYSCSLLVKMLTDLGFIPYELVIGPISISNIEDVDVLFIGAPTRPLSNQEVEHVAKFLALKNKFVVLTSSASSLIGSNLNILTGPFGIAINNDLVHVSKNIEGQFFPVIKNINKHTITRGVGQILYSGASLDVWGDDARVLASTGKKVIPSNVPIIALACSGRLLVLGGHTLFLDEPKIGLAQKNNLKFVRNFFTYVKRRIKGKIKEKPMKSSVTTEFLQDLVEDVHPSRRIKFKDAKKMIEKDAKSFIKVLADVEKESDIFWSRVADQIHDSTSLESLERCRQEMKRNYGNLRSKIENGRNSVFSLLYELDGQTTRDLQVELRDIIDQVYVAEGETATKLDTIRNNLVQLYNGKKATLGK